MGKHTLGELESLVLLAALRLGKDGYGLSITQEIRRTADRPVVRASVYVTLQRLEKRGLLTTRLEKTRTGGKPRRFVTVTPEGVELLRSSRASLQRMWAGLDDVLGEEA